MQVRLIPLVTEDINSLSWTQMQNTKVAREKVGKIRNSSWAFVNKSWDNSQSKIQKPGSVILKSSQTEAKQSTM